MFEPVKEVGSGLWIGKCKFHGYSHPWTVMHVASNATAGKFRRRKDAEAFAEFLRALVRVELSDNPLQVFDRDGRRAAIDKCQKLGGLVSP